MLFSAPLDIDAVAAELNQEHEADGVVFAEAVPGTATADSPDVVSSSPVTLEYRIEIGVDGSEVISDDPDVLTAVADVLSTPASKSFTKRAVEAINDVQDSCEDDFAIFCKEHPTPLGFAFSDVRSLFDELMSNNEDVSATSTNPVATWYRRHLTEESHAQHAGSAGMRFLQAMKDAVAPGPLLGKLKGLLGHSNHGRHEEESHRRMDAAHGKPVHHEHTGHRDRDNGHGAGPHRVGGTWAPRHPHVDKPIPPAAPATPVAPAPAPPPAATATRHLLGESPMVMPHFRMDGMPKMPPAHFAMPPPMPRMGAMPMGPMREPMGYIEVNATDSDSGDDDGDDDDDNHSSRGMHFHFKGGPHGGPQPPFPPPPSLHGDPYGHGSNSYSGALGFGTKGDSCVMLNYAKLSTECKASLRAVGLARAEYMYMDQAGGDGHWHGHHHHHPLLFFALLGAFGYFFYKRHMKMKSIRQILNVIDANPALKAQVEAAAGVEIPKHGERCESVCNMFKCVFKSFGNAAIFVGAFFFIAVTTLTLSGIVVSAISDHKNRKCHEYNDSLPSTTVDPYAYHQCEGPGYGLILFVVFTIAAIETTVLVYFGKRIRGACGCSDAPSEDADAPSVVATGANWYPGQIYAALPADSSHGAGGGAEMKTFAASTGTSSVTVVSNNQPVQMREVRPYSQVTML